ncbi:type IV secretory system conjugative DNA transfer family protein [Acinetobacter baumannii]|uniref:type IV secretory system conjugative DNA transfer family protein n=3 Tax=Acinetobacter baumannii TaxID=470 RepID=UPI00233FE1BC|nr:type IV secretory system conjugative DNA transfer family protein [Acinetobacter baumannii]MDC4147461.1 type IV secretory system conjugative DNA transfer family protein [Acinetobacter baumannii]
MNDKIEFHKVIVAALVIWAILQYFCLILANYIFIKWHHLPIQFTAFGNFDLLMHYWNEYNHIAKIKKSLLPCILVALGIPVIGFLGVLIAFLMPRERALHGDAKFANTHDVNKANLFPPEKPSKKDEGKLDLPAVLLGKYKGKYLQYKSFEFIILAAPTRSGKGVGFVIPNLLTYKHSTVVLDLKLENFDITSGFRAKHGQKVYLFAPNAADYKTHRWNCLTYIRKDKFHRVSDIQVLAQDFYSSENADSNSSYFLENAQTLFLGCILYLLDTPEQPLTMANVIKMTTPDDGSDFGEWIKAEVKSRKGTDRELSIECANALMAFASNSDNTRSSILSTMTSPLNIFRDPIVAAATSGDDFDLREVRKQKMSIYIGIQPSDLARFSRLINVFFSQLLNLNTQVLPSQDKSLKYQCLLMMDEFTALGRIKILEKGVGFIAGYNMRLAVIIQGQSQLNSTYGEQQGRTFVTNMGASIAYAPREQKDAVEVSETLGYMTVKSTSRSNSSKGGTSRSTSDQRRALMLPQEVKEMSFNQEIVFMAGIKPIMANKIIYHEDKLFTERCNLPKPPIPELDVEAAYNLINKIQVTVIETVEAAASIDISKISNKDEMLESIEAFIGFRLDY